MKTQTDTVSFEPNVPHKNHEAGPPTFEPPMPRAPALPRARPDLPRARGRGDQLPETQDPEADWESALHPEDGMTPLHSTHHAPPLTEHSALSTQHSPRPQGLLPGIEHPKPLAQDSLPILPMQRTHVGLIMAGQKVATLRTQRLPEGQYRLCFGGLTHATVQIETPKSLPWSEPLYWATIPAAIRAGFTAGDSFSTLTEDGRKQLVAFEGYRSVAAFETACEKLAARPSFRHVAEFLRGERPLFLHWLKNPLLVERGFEAIR